MSLFLLSVITAVLFTMIMNQITVKLLKYQKKLSNLLTKFWLKIKWLLITPLGLIVLTTLAIVTFFILDNQYCHMDLFFKPYLIDVSSILMKHNIPVWLNGGSLLGIVRDEKIISWDYDVDMSILSEDLPKLYSMKKIFESSGYTFITRDDFIWDKWGGTTFYIEDPAVRIYFPRSPITRFFIEIYDWHTLTLQNAIDNGYMPPRDYETDIKSNKIKHSDIYICDNEAKVGKQFISKRGINNYHADRCLLKNKIYPLKKWHKHPYNISYLMPQDLNYTLYQWFGSHWKIPVIKGWKKRLCIDTWREDSKRRISGIIAIFYIILFYFYYKYRKIQKKRLFIHNSRLSLSDIEEENTQDLDTSSIYSENEPFITKSMPSKRNKMNQ